LEGWRYFNSRRTWIEENWLNPIYGLWLEEAVNAGQVDAPGFYDNRYAWSATRKWTMTGRGWVDPAKEATGAEKRMGARISSLASECQEQGTDWRDVTDEIKIIEAYAKEQGVELYAKGLAGSPQEQIDLAESNADGSTDQQDAQDDVDQQDQQDQAA
jgi:capsid protein